MKRSLVVVVAAVLAGTVEAGPPVLPFERDADPVHQGRIDELVLNRLEQLGIAPAKVCSDGVFVRRVYLDVTGTLPTADEAQRFLSDSDPDKRRKLVDRLLQRDEFVDYWTMRWCDLLRVKSEFPINLWPNAVQAYHRWIRTCVKENVPYDRFVREMLTASGSNFRKPQVNFYRAVQSREPQAVAQAVALSFMGVRPEGWSKERWLGMAVFFSQIALKPTGEWKEEIVLFDLEQATAEAAAKTLQTATFPDGTRAKLAPGQDPRKAFANWLLAPKNPWFARAIANRVWFWLLGRGIVHPPDDIRQDNPPVNPELLAFLEQELVSARYDLKHLYRLILNSTTYQRSHISPTQDSRGEANFACYGVRRLEAEVLIDALCQISGTREQYSSIIPEPYTFMPEDQRSVAMADASITSPFLEKFGRSSRDTGLQSDRSSRTTAAQRLHMLNSSHIRRKIEGGPKLQPLIHWSREKNEKAIPELYLTILSRLPTDEELQVVKAHGQSGSGRVLRDLAWALINSPEFSFRH
ncbi:MAG: DUF1553 domain-containing protein [Candidatus Nealsonbacteria bacterium]|nr:DUF1553 domain-containing protein [Candidatus Nealsonbacteria bacterium]